MNTSGKSHHIWLEPESVPELSTGTVHVWQAELSLSADMLDYCHRLLDPAEVERSRRLHFEKHRNRFVAARGMLRILSGLYLSMHPAEIEFNYSRHGKPNLKKPVSPGLTFNISHSHNLALLAFSLDLNLGVDVERVREGYAQEGIAERFFSAREIGELHAVAAPRQDEAFFYCWTRKEAIIKAIGEGLSLPLSSFDVTVNPDRDAQVLEMRIEHAKDEDWHLHNLVLEGEYKAALAWMGKPQVISLFNANTFPGLNRL